MKLLIVDDEIYAIQGILDSVDWSQLEFDEIVTANSYAQAVNQFIKEPADILLCDIEMPYGSGLELVEWVRENYPNTECIFLTCHDEFDFARQAVSLQALDYVLKPAEPEKIVKVLRKGIEVTRNKAKSHKYEEYGKRYVDELNRPAGGETAAEGNVVDEVKKYIQSNISETISVEEIAGRFYISSAHLSRLFKRQEGRTLIDYIINERMVLARELLEQDRLSITMVAAKVGFNNYSHFTKTFKKLYGETPREYQAKCRSHNSSCKCQK